MYQGWRETLAMFLWWVRFPSSPQKLLLFIIKKEMEYLKYFWGFMLFVFISYISFVWIKYGIQRSISDSYYKLSKKLQPLFVFFCWGFAFPAIVIGVTLTDNFLMFLAGTGICFVGAAAAFKENLTKIVHMIGAYGGVFFSQLSIALDFKMFYVNIIFITIAIIFEILSYMKKMNNKIWWQEILAFLSIVFVFYCNLF
ncbi:MAG TPA: hypothetical protein PLN85_00855 [archaeon]|nr:hypothetical protein [archaeon]